MLTPKADMDKTPETSITKTPRSSAVMKSESSDLKKVPNFMRATTVSQKRHERNKSKGSMQPQTQFSATQLL